MAERSIRRQIALADQRRTRLRRAVSSYCLYKEEKEKRDAIRAKAHQEGLRFSQEAYQVDLEGYLQEMSDD